MAKVFKVYQDQSNSWLAVKFKDAQVLGLLGKISNQAYVKGLSLYLDGSDRDLFQNAYATAYGALESKVIDHGKRSTVRNYLHYNPMQVATTDDFNVEVSVQADPNKTLTEAVLEQVQSQEVKGYQVTKAFRDIEEGVVLNLPEVPLNLKSDF